MKSSILALWLGLLLFLHPGAALAQSCTGSSQSVAFGNVDVVAGSQNYQSSYTNQTAANVTVTCGVGLLGTGSLAFSACVNIAGGGASWRTMANGGSNLSYNLYSDSNHINIWGAYPGPPNAVGTTINITSVLLGASGFQNLPIYGYLPSSQNTIVIPGSYNGSPSATISYNWTYSTLGTPATPQACTTGLSGSGSGLFSSYGSGTSAAFALAVSATVTPDCTVSASPLNFGSVGVLSSAVTASTTISATCTNTVNYTVNLDKGKNGTLTDRQMINSGTGAVVHYQLYTSSGYGTVWGDGSSGTGTNSGTGTGLSQGYTVYGSVQAQTTPAPNTYTDTVIVTVTY